MGIGTLKPQGAAPLRRAVFLDRAGVLNEVRIRDGKPFPPTGLDDVVVARGVREGLRRLHDGGFLLIGATNQPDVSRGVQRREVVEAINALLTAELGLDEMRVCWHDDEDDCRCRKPRPGLLLEAAQAHGIALEASYMVGDRWRDIEAGQAARCRTVWVRAHYAERGPMRPADFIAEDFAQAADWILRDAAARG